MGIRIQLHPLFPLSFSKEQQRPAPLFFFPFLSSTRLAGKIPAWPLYRRDPDKGGNGGSKTTLVFLPSFFSFPSSRYRRGGGCKATESLFFSGPGGNDRTPPPPLFFFFFLLFFFLSRGQKGLSPLGCVGRNGLSEGRRTGRTYVLQSQGHLPPF